MIDGRFEPLELGAAIRGRQIRHDVVSSASF
jgi:hypothetical protein